MCIVPVAVVLCESNMGKCSDLVSCPDHLSVREQDLGMRLVYMERSLVHERYDKAMSARHSLALKLRDSTDTLWPRL